MNATIEIPNDLYRQVKAKSALRACTVREVTISLYRNWLEDSSPVLIEAPPTPPAAPPAWFAAAKAHAKRVEHHDMPAIRKSISKGRKTAGDLP